MVVRCRPRTAWTFRSPKENSWPSSARAVVERLRCSKCSAHSTSPAWEPYHRGEHRRQMQGLKNKADLAGAVGQWIGQIGNRVSAIVRLLKSVGADHRLGHFPAKLSGGESRLYQTMKIKRKSVPVWFVMA